MWCYACGWNVRGDLTLNSMVQIHTFLSVYVTWSRVELWLANVPASLSNFCCRTHFARRDVRVERSSVVTIYFQNWKKCLLKKCANGPSLYDTKSPDYRDQHMRDNAWEGIGMGLKIKRKFDVSSRDVRIVCPRLKSLARRQRLISYYEANSRLNEITDGISNFFSRNESCLLQTRPTHVQEHYTKLTPMLYKTPQKPDIHSSNKPTFFTIFLFWGGKGWGWGGG
jgi:hypothetical protein